MTEKEIYELVTPLAHKACETHQAFLAEIIVKKGTKKSLEIIAQTDTGITSQTCTDIARSFDELLGDVDIFDSETYHFEVTSPGIGRPIHDIRLLNSQINRTLAIEFPKETGKAKVLGKLLEIKDQQLVLEITINKKKQQVERVEIPFSEATLVTVEVSF